MFTISIERRIYGDEEYFSASPVELFVRGSLSDIGKLKRNLINLHHELEKLEYFESLASHTANGEDLEVPRAAEWFLIWIKYIFANSCKHALPNSLRLVEACNDDAYFSYKYHIILLKVDGSKIKELLNWSLDCWNCCLQINNSDPIEKIFLHAPRYDIGLKTTFLALAWACITNRVAFSYHEDDPFLPMLAIGAGQTRQYISEKLSSETSLFGAIYSKNKNFTKRFLVMQGIPVALGTTVQSFSKAMQVASQMGYPVVIKPTSLDQGVGIHTNIKDELELRNAFEKISKVTQQILIEKHVYGNDYRAYIVKGRLVSICQRLPAMLRGDGFSSIEQLIHKENHYRIANPIKVKGGFVISNSQIEIDEEAITLLKHQNLDLQTVVQKDHEFTLRHSANFGRGGTVISCLEAIHPWNTSILLRLAKSLHLDVCGIDILSPDIGVPLHDNNGCICEVNTMPGVLPHLIAEPNRDIMGEILDIFESTKEGNSLVIGFHGEKSSVMIEQLEQILLKLDIMVSSATRTHVSQLGFVRNCYGCNRHGHETAINNPMAEAILLEIDEKELDLHGIYYGKFDLFVFLANDSGSQTIDSEPKQYLSSMSSLVIHEGDKKTSSGMDAEKSIHFSELTLEVVFNTLIDTFPSFFCDRKSIHNINPIF